MTACQHTRFKRHGFTANGKQRYECIDCGATTINGFKVGNNRIPEEKERAIRELLEAGKSIREIRRITGCATWTISHRRDKPQPHVHKRTGKAGHCDYCGNKIGTREFDRRKRRTNHKFCSHDCFQAFYREVRSKDRCKRCGVKRYEMRLARGGFSNGLCSECRHKLNSRRVRRAVTAVRLEDLGKQLASNLEASA